MLSKTNLLAGYPGNDGTRVHATKLAPARRGMALIDAIYGQCRPLGGGGIFLKQVMDHLKKEERIADRIVVVCDAQDCGVGSEDSMQNAKPFGRPNYMLPKRDRQRRVDAGERLLRESGRLDHRDRRGLSLGPHAFGRRAGSLSTQLGRSPP